MILSYAAVIIRLIPARAGKTSRSRCGPRSTGAHPRACGENGLDEWPGAPAEGSSPRVRGKLFVGALDQFGLRLIPARAGKTTCTTRRSVGAWAHPRACGENGIRKQPETRFRGSSPRVRGKPDSHGMGGVHGRLIPARAGKTVEAVRAYYNPRAHPRACGKTASTARTRACSPAHPRACGENSPGRASLVTTPGSSPRVRGKPTRSRPQGLPRGLIPARAGKTLKRLVTQSHAPAHPRACGENGRDFGDPLVRRGSSPRVRGKPAPGRARRDMEGLIPARAGKTSRSVRGCGSGRAHPRACGENVADLEEETSPDGSSPRVRGKPEQVARQRAHPGLIPARAGKTPGRTGRGPAGTAHPRACGENYKRPSR